LIRARRARALAARRGLGPEGAAAVLVGLLGLLVSARAEAGPPGPSTEAPKMAADRSLADALVVEPGATCLERATLLNNLLSWRDSERVDLRVTLRVRGSAVDPLAVMFTVVVGEELVVERRFAPAPQDCADLHAVVALALAIALDDTLAGELGIVAPPNPLAPSRSVAQIEARDGDLPAEPAPTRDRAERPALAVTAAAGVFAGLTPRLSAGGTLSFDIRPRDHFDVRLGALATHLPGFALDTGEVAITLAAARVDLCWGSAPISVRVRVCGGMAGGATLSRGRGFATNFQRTTPWFAAIVGIDLAIHLVGPLALDLALDGVFPVQRTRLDVRSDAGQLLASERLPIAGIQVFVGPRFEF
jgi:hypothetical protein